MSVANDRAQVHVRAADRAMVRVYDQLDRAIAAMDTDDPRRRALMRFKSATEDPYGWLLQHANGDYLDEGLDSNEPAIEELVRKWSQ